MDQSRPVFLNLLQMKFPVTAISSILHRLSGLFLFVFLPCILYFWQHSLVAGRDQHFAYHLTAWGHLVLWLWLSSLLYHLLAGVRHMIMDLGFAEELVVARRVATATIILAVLCSIVIGIVIW